MKRFLIISLMLFSVTVTSPVLYSDMPTSRVEVIVSSQPAVADVNVNTKMPGQIKSPPPQSHWWTIPLRLIQEVLGGSIFLSS